VHFRAVEVVVLVKSDKSHLLLSFYINVFPPEVQFNLFSTLKSFFRKLFNSIPAFIVKCAVFVRIRKIGVFCVAPIRFPGFEINVCDSFRLFFEDVPSNLRLFEQMLRYRRVGRTKENKFS
jgi:hypothetical protein